MARKQEQERASEEVTEVAPDVLRMQLDIRIPGLAHVNCYALLDDEGAAVVDPGLPGADNWRCLEERLRQANLRVKDVHTVLVTHSHPDHFGGAVRFAKEAGSKVVAHEAFAFGTPATLHWHHPEVSADDLTAQREANGEDGEDQQGDAAPDPAHKAAVARYTPAPPGQRGRHTPWGGQNARPPLRMFIKWKAMQLLKRTSWVPTITHTVRQGDRLRLARREWLVLHTPGHTEDHFCLHDRETGTFLAGDHVLPSITPHISGLSPRPDPLLAFFHSLDQVAELPDIAQVLPAHGHPFSDLAERAVAIQRHHHERLDHIRRIGRELGPATVADISHKLFKPRSWGPMAESETYAHLEHLRLMRDAECHEDTHGKLVYTTG